jgi:hypothetical protein
MLVRHDLEQSTPAMSLNDANNLRQQSVGVVYSMDSAGGNDCGRGHETFGVIKATPSHQAHLIHVTYYPSEAQSIYTDPETQSPHGFIVQYTGFQYHTNFLYIHGFTSHSFYKVLAFLPGILAHLPIPCPIPSRMHRGSPTCCALPPPKSSTIIVSIVSA